MTEMALHLRESVNSKFKAATMFVAAFALVLQPFYGFVAGQVANALQPLAVPSVELKTESGKALSSGVTTNERNFTANLSASDVTDQSYFNMHLTVTGMGSSTVVYDNVTKLTADSNPKIGAGSFNNGTLTVLSDGNFNYPANAGQGVYTAQFQVCKTVGDCSAFTQPVSITYDASYVPTPPAPVCTYDFQAQKMWEVTWGYDFAHRNGGAPKFTMQSNGGLTSLNGGPVPVYMSASWHWLYITEGQQLRHYDYGFADGTVRTADITFSDVNGCQVPEIVWGMNTSSTTFVNDPKYVRENNGSDLAAQLVTPDSTTDVRFFVDGNTSTPFAGSNVGGAGATTSWWRLYTPLAAGQHTVSAEIKIAGQWYPVSDTGIVYSLDAPTATYVSPNDTNHVFRPSDNPIRVKAEDQFNQFKSMDVKIGTTTYTVLREDCDLRAAGNYVLCDVNASHAWANLSEGTYTAVTSVKTQANNRLDGLTSRQFTVDGTAPLVMNAAIVSPTNTSVYKDSIVLTHEVKEAGQLNGVKFYVTKPRTDGQCDPNEPKVLASQSTQFVNHDTTNGVWYYRTTIDTSSLNGVNCIFSVAEDAAMNHSNPQVAKISANFDNIAPGGDFTYSNNKAPTKGNVYAYLTTTEPVTVSPTGSHGWESTDGTGLHFKHKFTNNGSFDAIVTDVAGNSTTLTASVDWIDKTAPSVTRYTYSNNGNLTKNDVTVTITTSEPVKVPAGWTGNDGDTQFTQVFSHNGQFYVDLTDMVGNTATVGGKYPQAGVTGTAEVKGIDKNAPAISGITDGATVSGIVHLSISDPKYEGADGFNASNGLTVNGNPVPTVPGADKTYLYDITNEGYYEVFATDKAGNVTETLHFTIDNTPPALSVKSYSGSNTKPTIKGTTNSADDVVTVNGSTTGVTVSPTPNTDGTYDWTYKPSTAFPVGKTTLTIRSTDPTGNYTEDKTTVTVLAQNQSRGTGSASGINNANGNNSRGPLASTDTPTAPVTVSPAALQTTGQASAQTTPAQDVKASETTTPNSEKKEVKGLETTADTAATAGSKDGWNFFGFAWYWWLVLLAVITALWWIIAAKKRRAEDNA